MGEPPKGPNTEAERAAFAVLLDSYGGDRARWPAAARLRFASLLASDPAARDRLREAEALDRVLAAAPRVPADQQDALAARILAAATAAGPTPTAIRASQRSRRGVTLPISRSAVLLAAALAAGLVVGLTGLAAPAVHGVADALIGDDADLALVLLDDDFGEGGLGGIEDRI